MCATSIIGGTVADAGDLPYAVSIQTLWWPYHLCTGSLWDATTVLTSGHCFYDMGFEASDLVVRIGSRYRSEGGILANISSVTIHPSFTDEKFAFDVGIVKLQEPIVTTSDIDFATLTPAGSDPKAGTIATAAGWGDTSSSDKNGSESLRDVDVPILNRGICADLFRGLHKGDDYLNIDESMVCAGDIDDHDNGRDTCKGDSGGPLIDTGTGLLIGVTSWGGEGCGDDGYVGVYARVGHARGFIDKYMEGTGNF